MVLAQILHPPDGQPPFFRGFLNRYVLLKYRILRLNAIYAYSILRLNEICKQELEKFLNYPRHVIYTQIPIYRAVSNLVSPVYIPSRGGDVTGGDRGGMRL